MKYLPRVCVYELYIRHEQKKNNNNNNKKRVGVRSVEVVSYFFIAMDNGWRKRTVAI